MVESVAVPISRVGDCSSTRRAITAFIENHHIAWEGVMAILTVLYVVLASWSDGNPGRIPAWLFGTLTGLFALEFSLRCWASPSRLAYVRHHWIDIVACVPFVGALRSLRILRLLRLAAGIKFLNAARNVSAAGTRRRNSLDVVLVTLAVVWLCSAQAMWTLEHGINPHLHTFIDALFWAAITTTTVGYGDIKPVTEAGQIVGGLLVFVGIGLVGYMSSQLTSMWLGNAEDEQAATQLKSINDQLTALRMEIASASAAFIVIDE